MHEDPKEAGRFARFFEEKGFYIILFLCVAAIGIAGYVLFFDREETEPDLLLAEAGGAADEENAVPAGTLPLPGTDAADKPETDGGTPYAWLDTAGDLPEEETETAADAPEEPAAPSARSEVTREAVETIAPARSEAPAKEEKAEEAPAKSAPTFFVRPVSGEVLRTYSGDELVYERTMGDWRTHNGVDILAPDGAPVCAVADGVVEDVYHDEYYGTGVLIDHGGGLKSAYLGLIENATVSPGQEVRAGDTIGAVCASVLFESLEQVHLHLEMTMDGARVDPLDYIPA